MSNDRWRILIVEDDYFIADDLATGFAQAGLEIVGPVPSLAKAQSSLARERVDGAVLDVNLGDQKVYEVADALIGRGVPIVFVTGYELPSLPDRYGEVPLCLKPVDTGKVLEVLERLIVS